MSRPRAKLQITFADQDSADQDSANGDSINPLNQSGPQKLTGMHGTTWIWAGLLVLVAAISFWPAVGGTFLPQDDWNVTENPFLRARGGLWGIWRLAHTDQFSQFSPLGYSLLLIEHRLWGHTARHAAMGYHLVSLAMHIINALLLWRVLNKVHLRGSFVAAALFAAHPVQVQTVAWVSQQPMLLGTMLGLLSLTFYLRFCDLDPPPAEAGKLRLPAAPWPLYTLAALLFMLAVLAKPAMAVLPVVIILLIWWQRGKITRNDWKPLWPFLSIMAAASAIAMMIFHRSQAITAQEFHALDRLAIAGPALWFYLLQGFRVHAYSFVYPRWEINKGLGFALLLMVGLIWILLWRWRNKLTRHAWVALSLYFILLVPHIVFLDRRQFRDSSVADSAMYAATTVTIAAGCATFANVLSVLLMQVLKRQGAMRFAGASLGTIGVITACVLSFTLSRSYTSSELLWSAALDRYPNSVYALIESGALDLSKQRTTEAATKFRRALSAEPRNVEALQKMGAYYEAKNEPDRAYGQFYAALQQRPTDISARCGLARALAAQGDRRGALIELRRALADRPEYELALNDMAMIFTDLGEYQNAIDCYLRAQRAAPSYLAARVNLANLYFRMNEFQKAVDELTAAQRIDPDNFVIYVNIGSMCGELAASVKNTEQQKTLLRQSETAFRQALYLKADSAQAAHNLAVALSRQHELEPEESGKLQEAVFYFDKACQLDPANLSFQRNLEAARERVKRKQNPDKKMNRTL